MASFVPLQTCRRPPEAPKETARTLGGSSRSSFRHERSPPAAKQGQRTSVFFIITLCCGLYSLTCSKCVRKTLRNARKSGSRVLRALSQEQKIETNCFHCSSAASDDSWRKTTNESWNSPMSSCQLPPNATEISSSSSWLNTQEQQQHTHTLSTGSCSDTFRHHAHLQSKWYVVRSTGARSAFRSRRRVNRTVRGRSGKNGTTLDSLFCSFSSEVESSSQSPGSNSAPSSTPQR